MQATRLINVIITGNSTSLGTAVASAARDLGALSKESAVLNEKNTALAASSSGASSGLMSMANASVLAKGGILAIGAAAIWATVKAVEFDRAMRNVNSISQMSEAQFDRSSKAVLALSTQLPQSAKNLAEGLYDIASSGFQGADGLHILNESAIGASAGLSTTKVAAKAIVGVLNAYGLSVDDAAHVNNVLFKGVDVGIVTFEELATQIGDFIPTAAALRIPIEDATGALATMTLSGVNANEAATSLNRLMQSMVKPSGALAKTFASWGYESGESAIKALGLRGVMEKLRESTGGNITQLLALFPQIRAVRGALALMANDGKNYARVSKEMAHADDGQGASRKALAEQMKSASAQFQLFVNWLNATAITIGLNLVPVLISFVGVLRDVFTSIGGFISDRAHDLAGFFHDVVDAMKTAGSAIGDVIRALMPIGKVILGAIGGVAFAALTLFGKALVFVADTAKQFSGVIAAAVIVIGTFKAVSLITTAFTALSGAIAGAQASIGFYTSAVSAVSAGTGVSKATAAWQLLSGGMSGAAVATGVLAVGVVAVAGTMAAMANEASKAKKYVSDLTDAMRINPNVATDWEKAITKYQGEIARLESKSKGGKANGSGLDNLRNLTQLVNPWESNGIQEARDRTSELNKAQAEAQTRSSALKFNVAELSAQYGLTAQQVLNVANVHKIDLSRGFGYSTKTAATMGKGMKDLGERYGMTAQEVVKYAVLTPKEMEKAAKAEQKFTDEVGKSLLKSQDVFAFFSKSGDTIKKANADVAQATADLQDAQKKTGDSAGAAVDAASSKLDDAKKKLAEALKADDMLNPKNLQKFFADQANMVTKFTGDIAKGIQMGLNPEFIKQALVKGPEEAGPLLSAIVGDTTGKMVGLVNAGVDALQTANSKLIELSRIAYRASTASNQQMVKDSTLASKIALDAISSDTTLSAQALADKYQVPVAAIKRISDEYGIAVSFINGTPLEITMNDSQSQEAMNVMKYITQMSTQDPKIKVAMDIDDPTQKAARLTEIVTGYIKSNPTTKAIFDAADPEGKIALIQMWLKALPGTQADGSVQLRMNSTMDITKATMTLGNLQDRLLDYASSDPTAVAYLNSHNPTENAAYLKTLAFQWGATNPETKAYLEKYGAELNFDTLFNLANVWGATRKTAIVDAQARIAQAEADLEWLRRPRTAIIQLDVRGNPNMSIAAATQPWRWGGINEYANGGISPAHITDKQLIKYGEPQTGGEAYIPRKGDRNRSLGVIGVAASWLGVDIVDKKQRGMRSFAYGGLTGNFTPVNTQGGGVSVSMPVTIEVNALGDQAIGDAVSKLVVPTIEKQVDKVTKILVKRSAATAR